MPVGRFRLVTKRAKVSDDIKVWPIFLQLLSPKVFIVSFGVILTTILRQDFRPVMPVNCSARVVEHFYGPRAGKRVVTDPDKFICQVLEWQSG